VLLWSALFGATRNCAGEETVRQKENIMGDKSPKATHKHATQKQTKTSIDQQKKKQAVAAKQVAEKRN
jgi:hypothetical protein